MKIFSSQVQSKFEVLGANMKILSLIGVGSKQFKTNQEWNLIYEKFGEWFAHFKTWKGPILNEYGGLGTNCDNYDIKRFRQKSYKHLVFQPR